MTREIVFDTETTGLSPQQGDRLIEIGCIEIINKKPTGKEFHFYCHPETTIVGSEAFAVHKISMEFLEGKPFFRNIAKDLIDFIADSSLVAHNARFDMGFLNMEFERAGIAPFPKTKVIDTLWIARQRIAGLPKYTLDYLCDYFQIDRKIREEKGHGALLDAQILAEIYYNLMVEKEQKLFSDTKNKTENNKTAEKKEFKPPRQFSINEKEIENHTQFVSKIKNAKWETL